MKTDRKKMSFKFHYNKILCKGSVIETQKQSPEVFLEISQTSQENT